MSSGMTPQELYDEVRKLITKPAPKKPRRHVDHLVGIAIGVGVSTITRAITQKILNDPTPSPNSPITGKKPTAEGPLGAPTPREQKTPR